MSKQRVSYYKYLSSALKVHKLAHDVMQQAPFILAALPKIFLLLGYCYRTLRIEL